MKFQLENGLQIHGIARLSIYEPRGTYQLVFEFIEPRGTGALQLAFEQLKKRLAQEGLFDERHKKTIPRHPDRISIVTSPTGAVIHDIITIVQRRYPSVVLEVVPVKVQGDLAEHELCSALNMLNARGLSDVIIIARGGGSLEDLAAFNSEQLARSIFDSAIPVISAVGHETDYTICDFVADLRAPTPSAAAELVVPVMSEIMSSLKKLKDSLIFKMVSRVDNERRMLLNLSGQLTDPKRQIIDWRLRLDDMTQRLTRSVQQKVNHKKGIMAWRDEKLIIFSPLKKIREYRYHTDRLSHDLVKCMENTVSTRQDRLRETMAKLKTLNPLAILERGYSVTRTLPGARVLTHVDDLMSGQNLEIILSRGSLHVDVKRILNNGKKEF